MHSEYSLLQEGLRNWAGSVMRTMNMVEEGCEGGTVIKIGDINCREETELTGRRLVQVQVGCDNQRRVAPAPPWEGYSPWRPHSSERRLAIVPPWENYSPWRPHSNQRRLAPAPPWEGHSPWSPHSTPSATHTAPVSRLTTSLKDLRSRKAITLCFR